MDYETPVSFYVVVESQDMATLAPLLKMLLTPSNRSFST